MIPSPKLDDRSFNDIVDEAVSLIPRYAPEWTNHNPSDPGITLIELAAWMTDLLLYRLNRVPEKNYIAFLNLLGIQRRPPRAARALIQFALVEGADKQRVPLGTQIATPQATEEESTTFETERKLLITSVKLDRCFSYYNDTYSDSSAFVTGERDGAFEVFGGAERVDRFLYLSDPRLANAGDEAVLRVFLGCPERGGRDLARQLEWQYWNGDRWKDMVPAPLDVDRGEICFFGPLSFADTEVHAIEGMWMRGRLSDVPESPDDTEIDTIRTRVEVIGEGAIPDKALTNLDTNAFILLDLGKNMFPLGKEPGPDFVLYLACEELLQTPDAYISIELAMADPAVAPRPAPSEDLVLAWEYFDGKRWRFIGRSGTRGILPGAGDEYGFHDDTRAMSQTGTVSFRRPKDMEPVDVNGETLRWVRARVEKGDYGIAGTYTLEGDKWQYKDDRPLRPPVLKNISFKYREDYRDVRHVLTFNDFQFTDVTENARTEFTIFQPFTPNTDESPALYLGFSDQLPNEQLSLYIHTVEDLGLGSIPDDESEVVTAELTQYHDARRAAWESEQRVVWEYFDGKAWAPLSVLDGSSGFTTSGFVDFVGPDDWVKCMKFTEERHWFRARLEMGGYVKPPRIRKLLTNTVAANHWTTIRGEILGSSNAAPLQTFTFLREPMLEGEVVMVRERQRPSAETIEDLGGDEAIEMIEGSETEECWVRWRRVDSFFESDPTSHHYMLDYQSRTISFGDGRKGLIPAEAMNNIVAREYRIGGGARGNVNPATLTSLTRALSYVDSVTNPLAAAGGADRETVEEAKERAPYTIKSRDRAVTAEDFEMLALRASTQLARAKCVPDRTHRGAVILVVVPKGDVGMEDVGRRLVPSNEVLRYIKRYLDERRLVGTMLNVVKPRYRDLSAAAPHSRNLRSAAPRDRTESAQVLAPARGWTRQEGLGVRPPRAQDGAHPPCGRGPGCGGRRCARHLRRGAHGARRARSHGRRRVASSHSRAHRGKGPRRDHVSHGCRAT